MKTQSVLPRNSMEDVLREVPPGGVVLTTRSRKRFAVLPLNGPVLEFLSEHDPEMVKKYRAIYARMKAGEYLTFQDVMRTTRDGLKGHGRARTKGSKPAKRDKR